MNFGSKLIDAWGKKKGNNRFSAEKCIIKINKDFHQDLGKLVEENELVLI